MRTISNRSKGSSTAERGAELQPPGQHDDLGESPADLRNAALFVNGGLFRSLFNNPVKDVGLQIKRELTQLIAGHRHAGCELGFGGRGEAVDIRPLQALLEGSAAKLERYISGKDAPLQHVEIRLAAVPLQHSLELFSLSLDDLGDQGELSPRQVSAAVRAAIDLKAEISELLLNLEAAQLRLAEACENSTS